ncbi:hypothetical protein FB645_003792 [Coemansia sp. IMI 203386]|nr:hypothetical protein FB645_003792 [Coemansia sp. IMI 203386]
MPRQLLIDAAYAALSTAAFVGLFVHNTGMWWSMDDFRLKCGYDVTQSMLHHGIGADPSGGSGNIASDMASRAYRDTFTVKYYSPGLWCSMSWVLGALLSNKWHILHSYDRILNFVLFKVVSVRATLDADWEDLAIWTVAYCCFGALYLVGGLARDHLEGLRLSPAHPDIRWGFVGLLCGLIVSSLGMGALSWVYLRPLFSILCIEVFTILFDVGQTLTKYIAYAWDSSPTNSSTESWEARSDAVLLCEFATDICILVLTLLHYMHILVINGLTLNIVSALVFFNIRSIASKLYRKTRKLAAFQNAISSMKCRFPDATKEDIVRFDDRCSICREVLVTAKKLPCEHLFHRSCLRSWLVRHPSCPTCRVALSGEDVGQWASSNSPMTDTLEHGSDLVFATANTA